MGGRQSLNIKANNKRTNKDISKKSDHLTSSGTSHSSSQIGTKETDLKQVKELLLKHTETDVLAPVSKTDEEKSASPLLIRQQQLRDLQAARPELTDSEFSLICETWSLLKHQLSEVGSDLFDRYVFLFRLLM